MCVPCIYKLLPITYCIETTTFLSLTFGVCVCAVLVRYYHHGTLLIVCCEFSYNKMILQCTNTLTRNEYTKCGDGDETKCTWCPCVYTVYRIFSVQFELYVCCCFCLETKWNEKKNININNAQVCAVCCVLYRKSSRKKKETKTANGTASFSHMCPV